METNENGKALVRVQPAPVAAYEPRNYNEAYQIAIHFAKSGLLGEINTPEKAFLVMATGADLGIPATTALRTLSIVKGKPVLAADLMKAMCMARREICEHFRLLKSDDKIATYSAKRVGDDAVTMSFSMEDAQRAKLAERGSDKSDNNYAKYPAAMLRHRCTAMIAREVFPDIVLGVYCEEEADEIRAEARVVESAAEDDTAREALEQRIAAYATQIEDAQDIDALKAVVQLASTDPAAAEVKARLKGVYDAKREALKPAAEAK